MTQSAQFSPRLERSVDLLYAQEHAQAAPRPVRVWLQDESRVGLQLPCPRRLTLKGVKPIQIHQPLYEYYWLYAAVEPATGQAHWWEMPALDSACFEVFLQQLGEHFRDSLPDHVVLLYLPPYCPELNPIERLWQDLKGRITATDQTVRSQLDALREHVAQIINRYTPQQLQSITGFDYILEAVRGL